MAFRTICIAVLLSSPLCAGCGTAANLVRQKPGQGGVAPFGGVRHDMWCIRQAASGEFGLRTHPRSDAEEYPQVALMMLCAADLPLSFVGDLVTWPYTVTFSYINQPPPVPPTLIANPPVGPTLPFPVPPITQPVPIPTPPAMLPGMLPGLPPPSAPLPPVVLPTPNPIIPPVPVPTEGRLPGSP
jgi:uncharacterized protein YceK